MTDYTLNADAARAADQMNSRIVETGKYIGTLTRAEKITSKKGTVGVEFSFKADDGQSADYLSIWTKNADGKELFGLKQLQAIMVCCKQRSLTAIKGKVEKYDGATAKMGTFDAEIFPELTGQRIGLLLQAEEYLKQDQTVGSKMAIHAAFGADTEYTASEILDRAVKPEKLEKMVALLRDRKLPAGAQAAAPTSYAAHSETNPPPMMEDDIPF